MKVLTKVALGGLLNRLPEETALLLGEEHTQYLESEFLGSGVVWDSGLLKYKDGDAETVSNWLRENDVNKVFPETTDYVLASLLNASVSFSRPADEKFFELSGEIYRRSFHRAAYETGHGDLFQISVRQPEGIELAVQDEGEASCPLRTVKASWGRDSDVKLYVSRRNLMGEVDFNSIARGAVMELHVPYCKSCEEETVNELSGLTLVKDGVPREVSETEIITDFCMDNKGAKVKQAALMSFATGSLGMPREVRHPRIEVIGEGFFVYMTYLGALFFAAQIDESDFVVGDGEPEYFESRDAFVERMY